MNRMVSSIYCMMSCLLASFVHAETIELSFDTLFPETASKQLHDTVLQLWSDVTLLHSHDVNDKHKQELVDLITGQLVRIEYVLEYVHTKGSMRAEDLSYLQSVLYALSHKYKPFFDQAHVLKIWRAIHDRFDTCMSI